MTETQILQQIADLLQDFHGALGACVFCLVCMGVGCVAIAFSNILKK